MKNWSVLLFAVISIICFLYFAFGMSIQFLFKASIWNNVLAFILFSMMILSGVTMLLREVFKK